MGIEEIKNQIRIYDEQIDRIYQRNEVSSSQFIRLISLLDRKTSAMYELIEILIENFENLKKEA